jgi:hypothetical protein
MDQINTSTNENINPTNSEILNSPVNLPTNLPTKPVSRYPSPVWIIAAVIIILIGIFIATSIIIRSKPTTTIIMVTPTPVMLAPTPVRATNPIATSSAFLELEAKVTDLSNTLNKLNLNDSNLYPPVLDLSLGFSN